MSTRNHLDPFAKFLVAAVVALGAQFTMAGAAGAAEDAVQATVNGPFDKVVTNLKKQITAKQLVIVKEVPYQQMIAMVGVKSEPMMGFEIFHPRYGKVLYEKDVTAFKEAPLRIVVRAKGDKVILEYRKPSAIFAPYSGLSDMGKELDTVFAAIVDGAGN